MKDVKVVFYSKDLEKTYYELKKTDPKFFRILNKTTHIIKEDPGAGEQIPYKQIPKSFYKKFPDIKGMPIFVYRLPKAWRIIYAVANNEVEILAILVEICDHKKYDKIFGYSTS